MIFKYCTYLRTVWMCYQTEKMEAFYHPPCFCLCSKVSLSFSFAVELVKPLEKKLHMQQQLLLWHAPFLCHSHDSCFLRIVSGTSSEPFSYLWKISLQFVNYQPQKEDEQLLYLLAFSLGGNLLCRKVIMNANLLS